MNTRNDAVFGHAVTRHEPHATLTLDCGPPPTLAEKVIRGLTIGVISAAGVTLVVMSAAANPELFGAVFGAAFAAVLFSRRQ